MKNNTYNRGRTNTGMINSFKGFHLQPGQGQFGSAKAL